MSNIKVVLTGGPCAGKTTILGKIKKYYSDLNYNVIVIPETATELISSGVIPSQEFIVQFQDLIMKKQLHKQKIYETATQFNQDKTTIFIYDRGTMDNKAYLSDEQFKIILKNNKVNELELLYHYDLVIDLLSTATCNQQYYVNDDVRKESIEEASLLDKRTTKVWLAHPKLKIIPTNKTIAEEFDIIKKYIDNCIQQQKEEQKNYLVDCQKNFCPKDYITIKYTINYLSNNGKIIKIKYQNHIKYLYQSVDSNKQTVINYLQLKELLNNNFIIYKEEYYQTVFSYQHQLYYLKKYQDKHILCYAKNPLIDNIKVPEFINIQDEYTFPKLTLTR